MFKELHVLHMEWSFKKVIVASQNQVTAGSRKMSSILPELKIDDVIILFILLPARHRLLKHVYLDVISGERDPLGQFHVSLQYFIDLHESLLPDEAQHQN